MSNHSVFDMSLIIIITIFTIVQVRTLSLPSYIKPCPLNESDFDACALEHGQEAMPYIIKGDPEYEIPNLDPWIIPILSVKEFGLTLEATNMTIAGLDTGTLESIKTEFPKRKVVVRYRVPKMLFLGNYDMSGRLVSIPVRGHGDFNATMYNTILEYMAEFDVTKKDDEEYAVLKNYDMMFYPEDMEFVMSNLFGGNKLVGDVVHKFLNDNWRIVMEEAGRPATKYLGKELNKALIKACEKVPLKEIFT